MILVRPDVKYAQSYLEMLLSMLTLGEFHYKSDLAFMNFSGYVKFLNDLASAENVPADWVPSTTFWLVDEEGGMVFGMVDIRHKLNDMLEHELGHVGYAIRPDRRNRGFGTMILAMGLKKAAGLGLTRLLVTCDTDNVASGLIIENNGGELEDYRVSKVTGKQKARYWIDLTAEEVDCG